MEYDPVKRILGRFFNTAPWLRLLFYRLLDLLLLRSWHIRKELRHWYRMHKHETINILDAGFGFGQYSYFLSKMGSKLSIKSVDLKEEQVEDCRSFFGRIGAGQVEFAVADLTMYHSDSDTDLILCVDVMEHILDDVAVFRNFHASLKPGGMVLISTPSDQGGSDVHGHEDESFISEHVREGYSIAEMESKLMSAGFGRVECRYSYGTYGKISWRLSMKYPMMLLAVSKMFLIILPFYYLLTFPVSYILNHLDTSTKNKTGTGLIVKAFK